MVQAEPAVAQVKPPGVVVTVENAGVAAPTFDHESCKELSHVMTVELDGASGALPVPSRKFMPLKSISGVVIVLAVEMVLPP